MENTRNCRTKKIQREVLFISPDILYILKETEMTESHIIFELVMFYQFVRGILVLLRSKDMFGYFNFMPPCNVIKLYQASISNAHTFNLRGRPNRYRISENA